MIIIDDPFTYRQTLLHIKLNSLILLWKREFTIQDRLPTSISQIHVLGFYQVNSMNIFVQLIIQIFQTPH